MLEVLTYQPVLFGLIVLIVAGFAFPITGVYLLRMNLLPLRFMLMHGAILGGAIALAFQLNSFWTTMFINLVLVGVMTRASRKMRTDTGYMSIFIMVAAIGLAFVFIYKFNVPAKDTMGILWGNLYLLSRPEIIGSMVLGLGVIFFQVFNAQKLQAVFFDRSIAYTSGVNESFFYYAIILLTAFTVAIAMKLIGALLLDTLLILPAIIATFHARSHRGVILWSSIWGGSFSILGFFLSLWFKIPVSSTIALLCVLVFVIFYLIKKK